MHMREDHAHGASRSNNDRRSADVPKNTQGQPKVKRGKTPLQNRTGLASGQKVQRSNWNGKKKSSLPKKIILIALAAIIALGVLMLGKTCVSKAIDFIDSLSAEQVTPADPDSLPNLFEVSAVIGDELALQMIVKSVTNPDLAWIASNVDEYEEYGFATQRKLLRLATMDPQAVEFVRGYPTSFPGDSGESGLPEYSGEGVPQYYQYDVRWGYVEYGGKGIGLSGCAPTALAMVYQYITGNNDRSPYDMAKLAQEGHYITEEQGTYTSFFLDGVSSIGLYPHDLSVTADSIVWTLQNNGIIVANMREGDFTEGGHYIVLAGITEDGKIVVNDPYSSINSAKVWDAETIASQAVRFVGYYKS